MTASRLRGSPQPQLKADCPPVCITLPVQVEAPAPTALPRLQRAAAGAAAAALLLTSAPALAGDLALGKEVFDNK